MRGILRYWWVVVLLGLGLFILGMVIAANQPPPPIATRRFDPNQALNDGTTFFNNVAEFTGAVVLAIGGIGALLARIFPPKPKPTETAPAAPQRGRDTDGVWIDGDEAWEEEDGRIVREGEVYRDREGRRRIHWFRRLGR
jgi:hypothetical protein